jgi:uncharacterized phosphosugar-binding protein
MAFEEYLAEAGRALERLSRHQGASIAAAAEAIANALEAEGVLHVFGSGHSHLLAEEAFFRAGGLAAVNPILDPRLMFLEGALASTHAEREPGYAARILEREDVRAVDAAIVASNSGRNAVPIEMALELRARGVKVVAITSLAHAQAVAARHASGRKLYEIADIVVDTGIPAGDAAITLPGSALKMGPLSTVVGAALVHAIVIEAAALLVQRGHEPLVLSSANLDATSQEDLERTVSRYAGRIRYLDVPHGRT